MLIQLEIAPAHPADTEWVPVAQNMHREGIRLDQLVDQLPAPRSTYGCRSAHQNPAIYALSMPIDPTTRSLEQQVETSHDQWLHGASVTLRPATAEDIGELVRIRTTPEVYARWRGAQDMAADVAEDLADADVHLYVIIHGDRVIGAIQWGEETEPDYRHASIDVYLDPAVHGRGLGTDAVRTMARHLIVDRRHHRLVIDPAADNEPAIRSYTKVGFRPVGIMRNYERGPDGSWHDGLLMDLLAEELVV